MSDSDSIVSDDISVASEGTGAFDYDFDERSQVSVLSKASKASRGSSSKLKRGAKNAQPSAKDASEDYGDYSADFTDDYEQEQDQEESQEHNAPTKASSPKGSSKFKPGQGKATTQLLAAAAAAAASSSQFDTLLPPRNTGRGSASGRDASGIASPRNGTASNTGAGSRAEDRRAGDAKAASADEANPRVSRGGVSGSGQSQPHSHAPAGAFSFQQQSLQTEIVLEEISKEVLAMRNMQRQQLRERQTLAKEKRVRAEERRRVYEERLREAEEVKARAAEMERSHANQVRAFEGQIRSFSESKDVVLASLHAVEEDADKLRANLASVNKELRLTLQEKVDLQAKFDAARNEWGDRDALLSAEVKKASMLQATIQRSIEVSEARFAKERENLPAYQAQAIKEQQERLQLLEGSLNEREGALRHQEAYKLAAVDSMRKEAREELARLRAKADADVAQEKAEAHALLAGARSERSQWEIVKSHEMAALDQLKLAAGRKERELAERAAALDNRMADFEGARRMIQPTLDAIARDRNDTTALKEQADRVLLAAEEHASSVLAAERGLVRRDQELAKKEDAIARMQAQLAAQRKALAAEQVRYKYKRQSIETDRFKLHQASMDLAAQVAHVKRESLQIGQFSAAVGASAALSKSAASSAAQGQGTAVAIGSKYRRTPGEGEGEYVGADAGGARGYDSSFSDSVNRENLSLKHSTSAAANVGKRTPSSAAAASVTAGSQLVLRNVSAALENILQVTSQQQQHLDEEAEARSTRGEFSRSSYIYDSGSITAEDTPLFPPAPPPAQVQSALQMLDDRISSIGVAHRDRDQQSDPRGGISRQNNPLQRATFNALGADDLHSSMEGIRASSASMAAVASRYGIYAAN